MSVLLYLLIICSYGVFLVFWKEYSIEYALPIGAGINTLILFFCGLVLGLRPAALISCIIAISLYVLCAYKSIRNHWNKELFKNILTPGAAVFLLFAVLFLWIDYGKMAQFWDEFSHWATIVRAMYDTGNYGTVASADCDYGYYPPGGALNEVFIQYIGLAIGKGFSEWKSYYAFHIVNVMFFCLFLERRTATLLRKHSQQY